MQSIQWFKISVPSRQPPIFSILKSSFKGKVQPNKFYIKRYFIWIFILIDFVFKKKLPIGLPLPKLAKKGNRVFDLTFVFKPLKQKCIKTLNTFGILFWLNSAKTNNGKTPLYARITANDKCAELSLKRKLLYQNLL